MQGAATSRGGATGTAQLHPDMGPPSDDGVVGKHNLADSHSSQIIFAMLDEDQDGYLNWCQLQEKLLSIEGLFQNEANVESFKSAFFSLSHFGRISQPDFVELIQNYLESQTSTSSFEEPRVYFMLYIDFILAGFFFCFAI